MKRKRILVVDDEVYIVHILEFSLSMEGYEVLTAFDGEEAIQRIEADSPDLVVLDIMMPKLDGYEVCRRVREDERFAGLPIILLSAKGRDNDVKKGLEYGADSYMTKPFRPRVLLDEIERLLAGENHDQVASL